MGGIRSKISYWASDGLWEIKVWDDARIENIFYQQNSIGQPWIYFRNWKLLPTKILKMPDDDSIRSFDLI